MKHGILEIAREMEWTTATEWRGICYPDALCLGIVRYTVLDGKRAPLLVKGQEVNAACLSALIDQWAGMRGGAE